MDIEVTPVSRCLDKKSQIFGFEIPDLLLIFLSLSILNILFGESTYKIFFVWLPPAALAFFLRVGKRGRPDNFLIHWVKFQVTPGTYYAFKEPDPNPIPPSLKKRKKSHG